LDFNGIVFPVVGSDGLGTFIIVELLLSLALSPSSEIDVVGAMSFSNSLHWKS
jgi:hypothetical protein